jgi:regulator of protease activity HflC (stomatin/prohibitin superfamily)
VIYYWISASVVHIFVLFLSGMSVVRPTARGLVERLEKYWRFANPGFNWIIPIIGKMYRINITEIMVDAEP